MVKKSIISFYMFICVFTFVACTVQPTEDSLTLGVNTIITKIDKANQTITVKDSSEDVVLGKACLIDCSKIPIIYCNYDTQDTISISFDDLQVGDEIILTIQNSKIENLRGEDTKEAKIRVEQLQLSTQRIKS